MKLGASKSMVARVMAVVVVLSFLVFTLGMNVYAQVGNPGAIWTTRGDCGTEQQDVNQYDQGEYIYINGDGFDAGLYNWSITGQPGNASGDPNIVVASGSETVGDGGGFCINQAYLVALDDCGEYTVDFNSTERGGGNKNDNYHISVSCSQQASPTPEASPSGDPTPTPTATPTNETTDVCANIDGIQTSVPSDYHLDASQRNCVQFSVPGAPDNGTGGGGQVLGASIMAATGTGEDLLAMMFAIGSFSFGLGIRKYAYASVSQK